MFKKNKKQIIKEKFDKLEEEFGVLAGDVSNFIYQKENEGLDLKEFDQLKKWANTSMKLDKQEFTFYALNEYELYEGGEGTLEYLEDLIFQARSAFDSFLKKI